MLQPSNTEILVRLEEIFDRPEFNSGPEQISLLEMILRWLGKWLDGLSGLSPAGFWLVIGVCGLLLALLVGYIVWNARRVFFVSARAARVKAEREERSRLSVFYWEESRRCAAAGEFTEAIRFLFLSLVYRFDEDGRVNFQRAYTNREYLALFAERRSLYTDLKLFVDLLDDNWYGQRPSSGSQYEDCRSRHETLTQ